MIRMWMKSWGNGLEKGSHEWTQGKRFDYKQSGNLIEGMHLL